MIHFIFRCLGILLEILFYCLIVSVIVFFVSCSSVQNIGEKSASYIESSKELDSIINNENITPVQKIILKHASEELKQAEAQNKQVTKLHEKLVASSEKAGAGKLVYYIMYFVVFLVATFLGFKILKKFGI